MPNKPTNAGSGPRRGDFASQNGSYEPVIRIHTPVLDPGDTLKGDAFITGYGMIQRAKCVTYPTPGVFRSDTAVTRFGMGPKGNVAVFGAQEHAGLDDSGVTLVLSGGMQAPGWPESTIFFDTLDVQPPQISTEIQAGGHSPIEYEFPVRKDAKPGSYSLAFTLTYYDGDQWRNSSQTATFTIRSRFQRWEGKLIMLGAVAAAAGVISLFVDLISLLRS